MEHVADWAWTLDFPRTRRGSLLVKRGLDVMLSGALLIVLAPMLILVMMAIMPDQQGVGAVRATADWLPLRGVRYVQVPHHDRRSGASRKPFGAGAAGPFFPENQGRSPYRRPSGVCYVDTSIDELPQLYNVFRGDMSLLGPRPLLRSDLHGFPRASLMRRFAMKPGITGLWQVSGRSLLPDAERIRLDIDYVDNWSLTRDLADPRQNGSGR